MSQVVVTQDSLLDRRARSRSEENQIDRESSFKHWQKSDITTKHNPINKLIAVAFIPVIMLWALLLAAMGAAFWVFTLMLKGCSAVYRMFR